MAAKLDVAVGMTLKEVERKLVLATIKQYPVKRQAAAKLGICTKTLFNLLRRYKSDGTI